MNILVGLGNPGEKYQSTRHNVGFLVLDQLFNDAHFINMSKIRGLLAKINQHGQEFFLLKPQTFMNESGVSLSAFYQFYKIQTKSNGQLNLNNLFVIHDDLDIIFGDYKIQFGKGPKVHNGLLSIYQHLGTDQFWHVRIGVDNRLGDRSMPASAYVLSGFSDEERSKIADIVLEIKKNLFSKALQNQHISK